MVAFRPVLRFVHALVFALVAVFGIASGAHALGSETALRKNFELSPDRVGAFVLEAFGTRQQNPAAATTIASGSTHAARAGASALQAASNAAFKAAQNVGKFVVPAKHLPGAGGRWARFAQGVNPQQAIKEALSSPNARFLPNNREGSFRVVTDLGRQIGEAGETALRVVVGEDGVIWTAFPVRP